MGAKTKTLSTLTPEQSALMNSMMRGVMGSMQGFNLGAGWGGPSFESYNPGVGYGGKTFDMGRTADLSRRPGQAGQPQAAPANPMLAALQGIAIPGAPGVGGGSAAGLVSPTSAASYANRENLVTPIVNPFRRNLGG
jgi:hypothetical protein